MYYYVKKITITTKYTAFEKNFEWNVWHSLQFFFFVFFDYWMHIQKRDHNSLSKFIKNYKVIIRYID